MAAGAGIVRTPTVVVGDIHGDLDTYRALLRREETAAGGPLPSIQVGDYGVGLVSEVESREIRRFHLARPRHRFIRGNHDDPDEVMAVAGFIPDGTIMGRVLFLGGAAGSSGGPQPLRNTEMDEEAMAETLDRLRGMAVRPDVIVSHDAPQSIAAQLWSEIAAASGQGQPRGARGLGLVTSRTRLFLDEVLRVVQPSLWLFGHWHHPWAFQTGATHFRCVGYQEAFTLALPWRPEGALRDEDT